MLRGRDKSERDEVNVWLLHALRALRKVRANTTCQQDVCKLHEAQRAGNVGLESRLVVRALAETM